MASFNIGFVLFPDLTQLDFTGPLQVLHRLPGSTTHIVAKTRDPVPSDCGLSLVPTATFADCPQLDLLCVPGGFGVSGAIADKATVDFVRRQGARREIRHLRVHGRVRAGRRRPAEGSARHHALGLHGAPAMVGATYEKARVVRDGNVFTGGGVTAGIDFALTVAAEVAGAETAQKIQLSIEYDPAPPFSAGHPDHAPAAVREGLAGRYESRLPTFRGELKQAMKTGK